MIEVKEALLREILNRLLDEGLRITIYKSDNDSIIYDLNLMAKSDLYITPIDDNSILVEGRYQYMTKVITSYEYLLSTAVNHMCGRDFINDDWKRLLIKEGYLSIKEVIEFN